MKTSLFTYALPDRLIAQHPPPDRSGARMMVIDRRAGSIVHAAFTDLPAQLHPGDLLVLNDTRVIPARLAGVKSRTGGKVEVLFLEPDADGAWEVLMKAGRRPRVGDEIRLGPSRRAFTFAEERGEGRCLLRPAAPDGPAAGPETLVAWMEAEGETPLPPYIRRAGDAPDPCGDPDRDRYQTVFAREPGAVAAPTAGLHFTADLLDRLATQGVNQTRVTLHVGLGTFRPVAVDRVEDHVMHEERYRVTPEAAAAIRSTHEGAGRVIAVGTTAVRTVETAADGEGGVRPEAGRSSLFIRPPHPFQVVDGLLTNFHLPRSTLLMLVCAFGGTELILEAYRQAVEAEYWFYSYGDCMLIL